MTRSTPRVQWGSTLIGGVAPVGVNETVTAMMRRSDVSGLSVAVVDPDGVLFARGYGLASREASRPATASTAYLWFSMTKIVTATAALRLADEGRLDLDAPVGHYVDYLQAPGRTQPKVGQLLSHTAGLGNPLPIRWAHPADAEPLDPEALLRRVMAATRFARSGGRGIPMSVTWPSGRSSPRRPACRSTTTFSRPC